MNIPNRLIELLACIFKKIPFDLEKMLLSKASSECRTILDLGCGQGERMLSLRKALVQRRWGYIVGSDVHRPSLLKAKRREVYDEYIVADARCLPLGKKALDLVLCLDLLEHLNKKNGRMFLKEINGIAAKEIIILTPVGCLPQTEYDNNPFQCHLSGWVPSELRREGYEVRGVSGLRGLRMEKGRIRYKGLLGPIALLASILTRPFVYYLPESAFQMICYKSINR